MKRISLPILLSFLLTSCAAPAPTAAPSPTPISPPLTAAQTAKPNIPTIDVGGVKVPDPKVTKPELFDVTKPDSPIVQLANAFGVKPQDVISGLHAEMVTPTSGNPSFPVIRSSDGVALMMAERDTATRAWKWERAVPGTYWHAQGKLVGAYMDGDVFNNRTYTNLLRTHFSRGVVALDGQVRPNADRPPSNASATAKEAQSDQMALFFHYVAEPGKFPAGVDVGNIDSWLDSRLEGIAQLLKSNKTAGHPMYVSFNEAWEGNQWNPEANPLRDKYGGKWVEEYTYRLLTRFVGDGLRPNQDFVEVFNDGNLYDRPRKQELVYNTLVTARSNAFARMLGDATVKAALKEMGIHRPEDIQLLLGAETHTQLAGNENDGSFVPPPTDEQITGLSAKFEPLGGVLMTEVNPNGTETQQEQFVRRAFSVLRDDPNLKGVLLWHVFSPNDPSSIWGRQKLSLFDESQNPVPTALYYDLLR